MTLGFSCASKSVLEKCVAACRSVYRHRPVRAFQKPVEHRPCTVIGAHCSAVVCEDKIIRLAYRRFGRQFLNDAEFSPFAESLDEQIGNGQHAYASGGLGLAYHVFTFDDVAVFVECRFHGLCTDDGERFVLLVSRQAHATVANSDIHKQLFIG